MADGLAILALSQAGRKWREGLEAHAKIAGHSLHGFDKTSDALSWLDDHEPRAIVIDAETPRATTLVMLARAMPALADVPILALVPSVDDRAFARLLAGGADDVFPAPTVQRIVDRLKILRKVHSLRPPASRGGAVVADTDPTRCDVLARILAHAGYDVRLAPDLASLEGYAAEPDVQLVVVTTDLGDPEEVIPRVRRGASLPAWVVADPTLDPWANPRPVPGQPRAMRMSTRAQPDSVLFVSNALLRAAGRTARDSRRLLYGTSVGFRETGVAADDYGFSYNISAQGLFVRTLAPPPPGSVSLELEPPGHGRRLRFIGEVVWTRSFGSHPAAMTPPGFAVHLQDAHGGALQAWRRAYERLAERAGVPLNPESDLPPCDAPEELAAAVTDGSGAHRLVPPEGPSPQPDPTLFKPLSAVRQSEPQLRSGAAHQPASHEPAPCADTVEAVEPIRRQMHVSASEDSTALPHPGLPTAKTPPPPRPTLVPRLVAVAPPAQPLTVATPPVVPAPTLAASLTVATLPVVRAPAAPLAGPAPRPAAAPGFEARPPSVPIEPTVGASAQPDVSRSDWPEAESTLRPSQIPLRSHTGLKVAAAAAALATAGLAAWVFLWPARSTDAGPTIAPQPPTATQPLSVVASTSTEELSAAASSASAPSAPASSAPSAPATPPAPGSAQPETPAEASNCPASADGEGAELLSFQGYLTVCSNRDLSVYATGAHLGKTNQRLLARCGLKFVRLAEGDPPAWKGKGQTVRVACQGPTRIQIDVEP